MGAHGGQAAMLLGSVGGRGGAVGAVAQAGRLERGGCEQGRRGPAGLTGLSPASKDHLSAILAIKGNLSSSEVKAIRSILDIHTGVYESLKSLFSLIKVG